MFPPFIESDFESISNLHITFGPSESENTISIKTNSDQLVEGEEQFLSVLTSLSNKVIITANEADIIIIDDTTLEDVKIGKCF